LREAQTRKDKDDDEREGADEAVSRSSNLITILVMVSRVTGFFRTSAQAWALGAYGLSSAYTVANNLPNLLYELVVGGMLITSFLPVYIQVKERQGRHEADEYASNLLSIVLALMGVATLLSIVFAVPVVWTQSAGASEGFDSSLAVWFFRWFACEIVLYALSSLVSGVLNANRDYFASNVAPIFNNLIVIGSFVLYAMLVDQGVPWRQAALSLAVGNPLGVLVQVLVQLPAIRRQGIRLRPRIDLHDPALRDTLTIGLPTLVITAISTPTAAVTSSCALSVTPAGASIAYYARVWYVLPFSIFAIPISVTMFTELSQSYQAGDMDTFRSQLALGMRRVFFTLIPFALYLMVFAPCLIAVLGSGRFEGEALGQTVGYLQALALALPFYGLMSYVQKVCSSMMRMSFFMVATCVATVLQIVMCIWLTPLWGLYVVPVSSLFFYGVIDLVTLWRIRGELGSIGLGSVVTTSLRGLGFGLTGALVGWAILQGLTLALGPCQGALRGVLYAAAGGLPALLVTFGGAYLLHMSEAPFFDALFQRALRLVRR
jgi:putative peptidoglycan lipid II flippase